MIIEYPTDPLVLVACIVAWAGVIWLVVTAVRNGGRGYDPEWHYEPRTGEWYTGERRE